MVKFFVEVDKYFCLVKNIISDGYSIEKKDFLFYYFFKIVG